MRNNFPPVIRILLILNGIAFLASRAMPEIMEYGALHYWSSPDFKVYQLFTHMFLHANVGHIFFNMLALWLFGSILENFWGSKRFLNFYLICGLGAAIVQMVLIPFEVTRAVHHSAILVEQWPQAIQENIDYYQMVGASGAIMGVMAAFAYLFPNTEIYLYFALPIKAKYLIPVYVLVDLFGGLYRTSGDNVGHFAHLGGALVGIIIVIIWNRTNRRNFY
jgi:membrane associated rhomboid family serine protease